MIIKLSCGEVEIRCLGLYELDDNVPAPIIKPYTYQIKLGTEYKDVEYEYPETNDIPEKVDLTIEPEYKTDKWYKWQSYLIYSSAIYHLKKQRYEMMLYGENIRKYIQTNCIKHSTSYIFTSEDWKLIFKAALAPQITLEVLKEVSINTFAATYDGVSIIDAVLNKQNNSSSKAKVNPLRLWEASALMNSGLTEQEWIQLSIKERARRIVVYHINNWFDGLILSEAAAKNGSI